MLLRVELAAKESGDRSIDQITLTKFIYIYINIGLVVLENIIVRRSFQDHVGAFFFFSLFFFLRPPNTWLYLHVFTSSITGFKASTMRFSKLAFLLTLAFIYYLIFVAQGKADTNELLVGSAGTSVNEVSSLSLSLVQLIKRLELQWLTAV